jgi:hypothetical protein
MPKNTELTFSYKPAMSRIYNPAGAYKHLTSIPVEYKVILVKLL